MKRKQPCDEIVAPKEEKVPQSEGETPTKEEEVPSKEGETPQSKEEHSPKEHKKEQKIVYIDDGSQIADMSATRRYGNVQRQKSTAREKIKTYFAVVRRMLLPLLCTLIAFTLVFVILLAITGYFG